MPQCNHESVNGAKASNQLMRVRERGYKKVGKESEKTATVFSVRKIPLFPWLKGKETADFSVVPL